MKRKIVVIDEGKCNGCGQCIPNCHEGALQMIDNKARLISDLFCDGLGACIGHCPQGAITVEEREAQAYDERRVMDKNIVPKGENTIIAHLKHLKEHGATKYLDEALTYLKENGVDVHMENTQKKEFNGCPGAKMMEFENRGPSSAAHEESMLAQWPIQLHLVNPNAPYFEKKDVLLAADCTAYSIGGFHSRFLSGKSLVIACPKLDSDQEIYVDKIKAMIDESEINTLTVLIMEVPCCGGLQSIAKKAAKNAKRKVPIKAIKISVRGEILSEEWI